MPSIRLFRPGDEDALADICVRTADAGADATGILSQDSLWGDIFVLPYVDRHPELGFVLTNDVDAPIGYIVAAPDTDAFECWFRLHWWAVRSVRYPETGDEREDALLRYAAGRGADPVPFAADYPAHLHIDLLPTGQGQGWGRRLIDTLAAALSARGVGGLHLVAGSGNTGALAFYQRLGFTPLPSAEGSQAFGMRL